MADTAAMEVRVMKKVLLSMALLLLNSGGVFAAFPTTGSDQTGYCQLPPYLTQNVKPNINLVLDFSGSMQFPAYQTCPSMSYDSPSKVANCGSRSYDAASSYRYYPTRGYYGNFKSDLYYRYNATDGYFEENLSCTNTDRIGSVASNCLSGNLLNWAVTTRTDVLRKILTGGRLKSGMNDVRESEGSRFVTTEKVLHCKFTVTASSTLERKLSVANETGYTCPIGTFSNYSMDVRTTTPDDDFKGIVHSMYPELTDLELSVYNTQISSSRPAYRVGKNKPLADYVTAINSELAYNGTPTGEALREAYYYFKQSTSLSSSSPNNQAVVLGNANYLKDPYYEPGNLPAYCRKSFVLLISDGEWNGSTTNWKDPVYAAYKMRTEDLRTEAAMPDKQNVTTFAVYAFGDGAGGRQAMITTAIFGGFNDTDGNGWPYTFSSLNLDSRSVTYPRNSCNPGVSWNERCGEWANSTTGLPDNFYEAEDGEALRAGVQKAVQDILGRITSGTAASVLGNSDNNGATLLQALYYPEKQFSGSSKISWTGEIQSLWYYVDPLLDSRKINIREDTEQDRRLRLSEDLIARFVFNGSEVDVKLYADANADGLPDNEATPTLTRTTDDVHTLWRAGHNPTATGASLFLRDYQDRFIYTYNLSGTPTANNMMRFSVNNRDYMKEFLDVPGANKENDSDNIIKFVLGDDLSGEGYRNRRVTIDADSKVWKLGDIINSTPKMLTPTALNAYGEKFPGGYGDSSYRDFVSAKDYANRGTAFVGANDGMLHAFKLGKNFTSKVPYVSEVKNADKSVATDLGTELWGYVPRNVLPYLKHLGNPSYKHLFYVDTTPVLNDASIGRTRCLVEGTELNCNDGLSGTPYYECKKATTKDVTGHLDFDLAGTLTPQHPCRGTSWRTVLLGSMGWGGATRENGAVCTDCVKSPVSGTGYSSYFAMDVTSPETPKLLWEFDNPRVGFSTVRPAIVRIKETADTPERNGRWFAILASGPTGPIDTVTNQMKAFSDKNLAIFILDLKTGTPLRTFSADANAVISGVPHTQVAGMPQNAFGGNFADATIDTDKGDNVNTAGRYSDDAVYLGYVKKDTATGKFSKGGVLRLLTGDDPDPANWKVSTVIDGIGPVTSSVVKLQDRYNKHLWLLFGTGRYYYKIGSNIDEDYAGQQESIFGIKEPCYTSANDLDKNCVASVNNASLVNQTSSINTVSATSPGWKINLEQESDDFNAKRVISNPVATSSGIVYFTTFKPSAAVCSYGGDSSFWAMYYNSGSLPDGIRNLLTGQALLQLSTGAFKQVNLATDFTESLNRETQSFKGVPSKDEPPVISNANHFPSRRILHIQER